MGLRSWFIGLFQNGRNPIVETVEVFRENAEQASARLTEQQLASLAQFSAEFDRNGRNRFDAFMDGVNRLPRPALALGCLLLFVMAMVDPIWFGARMEGLQLVPEPLWWVMGVIVSFYFGARHQAKGHEFAKAMAANASRIPTVVNNIRAIEALADDDEEYDPSASALIDDLPDDNEDPNPALIAWKHT